MKTKEELTLEMLNLKDMARMALDVQDACNLSGVVHTWSKILPQLRKLVEGDCKANGKDFSTDVLNRHPVNVMFCNKLASLSGCNDPVSPSGDEGFSDAYRWALKEVSEPLRNPV